MEAKGSSGLVWIKPLNWVFANMASLDAVDVMERFFSVFGFNVKPQKNKGLVADMIAERNGEKYAVAIHKEGRRYENEDEKSPEAMSDAIPLLKVDGLISVAFGSRDPFSSLVSRVGGASLDNSDIKRVCDLVDSKDSFSSADEYKMLFDKLKLSPAQMEGQIPVSDSSSEDHSKDEGLKAKRKRLMNLLDD